MEKSKILIEIQQTAAANGGTPLGKRRFLQEAGIRESDWVGKYWMPSGDLCGDCCRIFNLCQNEHIHWFQS